MKVQIQKLANLNPRQQEKIISACNKGFPLIGLPVWNNRILKLHMTETRGMSNQQIIDLIMKGADGKGMVADGDIDIDITGFFKLNRTIGYTYLRDYRTWINRKFLDQFSESEVFGHLMHELLHKLNFTHNIVHATSVPYQIGYASRYAFLENYAGKSLLKTEMAMTEAINSLNEAPLSNLVFSIAS